VILAWRHLRTADLCYRSASQEDLLVLKMVVEGIDPKQVAATGNLPLAAINAAIAQAAERGHGAHAPFAHTKGSPLLPQQLDRSYLSAQTFTLQWHITQACDLHCKHCYDRTKRSR
jgi:hypothetical protein